MAGWFQENIGDKIQGAYDTLRGKDDLDEAERRREQGDALLDQQLEQIQSIQSQYETLYAPVLNQYAEELGQGPDLTGEADRARDEFGLAYDSQLNNAQRNQRRNGIDPTSSNAQQLSEDSAFDRALGSATAANQARTDEDDRHWARSLSFASGGNGVQAQVASLLGGQANAQYGNAETYANEAGSTLELVGGLVGAGVGAYTGNPGLAAAGASTALGSQTKDTNSFGTGGGLNKPDYNFQKSGQTPNSFGGLPSF